jgi:hypothetical protein
MKKKKTKLRKATQAILKPGEKAGTDATPTDFRDIDFLRGGEDEDEIIFSSTANEKHTKLFKEHISAGSVLFCPACACDWTALTRLSDVARVFVFCLDGGKKPSADALSLDNCPEPLRGLFSSSATGTLDTHTPFGKRVPIFRGLGGWYACFNRDIRIGGKIVLSRKLMVVLMHADPVTVYDKLFTQPRVAPSYVSLLHTGWQSPMSKVLLKAGEAAPKSIIADWPGGYGPWNWRWRRLRSWDRASVFQRRTDPAHPVNDLRQSNEIAFEALPLSPHYLNGADAVVVSLEQYVENWWLGEQLRIFIDSTDEKAVAGIRAYDRRVEPLPLRGRPLAVAADELVRACNNRTWHVHADYLGLEDEAEAIWEAWRNSGKGIRLVLHGLPSDWESLNLPCPNLD